MMLKNDHGDVVGLTANGEVKADYTYLAYGELIADGSNGINNPICYAGEYTDEESGLIYLRARYYDPGLGRFISEDTHWNPFNMIYGDNPDEEDKLNSVSNYNNGLKNESNKEKIVQSLLRKIKEINESKETVVQNQEDEVRNISLDSIMQSCNLYVYCLNNPITHIDPSGNGYSNIEISISRNGNSNQCQVYIHWTGEDMINAFSFDNLRINSLSLFGGRYSNIGGSFIRVPSSEVSTAGYVFVANVTIPNNVTAVRVTAIGLTGYTTYGYGVSILHTGIVKIN